MMRISILFLFLLGSLQSAVAKPARTLIGVPLSFEENRGQLDTRVLYLSRFGGHTLFFLPNEVVFGAHAVRMEFVGAGKGVQVAGVERLRGTSNYFVGGDPKAWRTGVPHFARVRYTSAYPGVDMVFYGNQRRLEYDVVLQPGADLEAVKLRFSGAEAVEVDSDGRLLVTSGGERMVHAKPFVYQVVDGVKREIAGTYQIGEDGLVGFDVAGYDESAELVVDPVIEFSTFAGGTGDEIDVSIVLDRAGNIFVASETDSLNFPTTSSALNEAAIGARDLVVFKMDPTASKMIFSTYIGGPGDENVSCRGKSIAVDGAGNVYLSGSTSSPTFPTTTGAYDTTYNGGPTNGQGDAFLLKLNPEGSELLYSTLFGGDNDEEDVCVAVDPGGDVVIVGQTESTALPTTAGAFDRSHNGDDDLFVARFRLDGMRAADLRYSTYLGGLDVESDPGFELDVEGVVNIVAESDSVGYPTTAGAFDTRHNGGIDVVVTRLAPVGGGASDMLYSTFFGGSDSDARDGRGRGIAVGPGGDLFITGETISTENSPNPFPVTPGAYDTSHNGGAGSVALNDDIFVARLRPQGKGAADLIYSTFIGGDGDDEDTGIDVDSRGFAYVVGETASTDYPTVDPIRSTNSGLDDDVVVSVLSPDGSELVFSTYLGGDIAERDPDVFILEQSGVGAAAAGAKREAIADNVAIYVVAETNSLNYPNTEGAFDRTQNGAFDVGITKIVQAVEVPKPELGLATTVSAASFTAPVAEDSIASVFAAIPVEGASEVSVNIVDSAGMAWPQEPFFFVATQANLYIPPGIALGTAKVTVLVDGAAVAEGEVEIKDVAPGIFFFGQHVAAAFALTIAPDGTRTQTDVFNPDLSLRPISLGLDGTAVYLLMFGTGIRDGAAVTATVNGVSVPILGYAPHSVFQGLDQVNIGPLPRALIGSGMVEVLFTVDGVQSNAVQVRIQ